MKTLAWILCLSIGCLLPAGCSNSTTTGSGTADGGHFKDAVRTETEKAKRAEEERARTSIEQVLGADKGTSARATSAAQVVSRMRAIDMTGCPNDFREAYLAHIHAWELLIELDYAFKQFEVEFGSNSKIVETFVRGLFFDFSTLDKADEGHTKLQAKYEHAKSQVKSTFDRVEVIAVRYGASLPKRGEPATK